MKGFAIVDFETTGLDPFRDYPIEVGIIYTDLNLNILNVYNSLILADALKEEVSELEEWPDQYAKAYEVHGITLKELKAKGRRGFEVLVDLCGISEEIYGEDKPYFVADCLNFDWSFLMRLWRLQGMIFDATHNFPFHYCGRDINLLFDLGLIEEVIKPKHRALADAITVYAQLVSAREVLKLLSDPQGGGGVV